MYKMVIDFSGEERVYLFRGPAAARRCSSGGAIISTAP